MKRYSCKVYFKDNQVHGNARVYVWAEKDSEVYDKAADAIRSLFKSSPVIVTSVTYQALKSAKRRAPGKAVAPK